MIAGQCRPAGERAAEPAPGRGRTEEARLDPIRVLLVDDHHVVRECLRLHLELSLGATIVGEAATAAEALRLVAETGPDVLVLDVRLPDASGVAVARWVRRALPGVAIVVYTGYNDPLARRQLLGLGVRGYLSKTARVSEVVSAIERVASGETVLAPAPDTPTEGNSAAETEGIAELQEPLTAREQEVLELLAAGYRNAEIAAELGMGVHTVEFHVGHVLQKLGVRTRTAAAMKAQRLGLLAG